VEQDVVRGAKIRSGEKIRACGAKIRSGEKIRACGAKIRSAWVACVVVFMDGNSAAEARHRTSDSRAEFLARPPYPLPSGVLGRAV
jgi:hypothetical protein